MNIHASNQRHSCHCYLCVHPKYTRDITRPEEKIASDPDSDKMTFCIFFKWLFSFHKHYMTFGLTRVASSCSCPTKPQQLDNSFRGIREDSDTQLLPPQPLLLRAPTVPHVSRDGGVMALCRAMTVCHGLIENAEKESAEAHGNGVR